MGEEQHVLDAVINIQNKNNENPLPEASAAFTQPVPIPNASPIHPCPSRLITLKETRPQATGGAILKVSAPETRNTLERVQMTRSTADPNSAKSDSHPATPGLNMSPPNIVHEPTPARKPIPIKPVPEMVSPISRPPLSSGKYVTAGEQSKKTVLNARESPRGSSLAGIKSSGRTVSTPFPKHRDVEKPSMGKAEVSPTKGMSAVKHLHAPKTTFSLSKPSTVPSTRAPPSCPSKYGIVTSKHSLMISK